MGWLNKNKSGLQALYHFHKYCVAAITQTLEGEKWNYNTVVESENCRVTATIMSPRRVAALEHLEPAMECGQLHQTPSVIRWLSPRKPQTHVSLWLVAVILESTTWDEPNATRRIPLNSSPSSVPGPLASTELN